MQKTKKRVLGVIGLAVVVFFTVLAALLPTPGTSAATTDASAEDLGNQITESR